MKGKCDTLAEGSYTSGVKRELCVIDELPECCRFAMSYALMLFGRSFTKREMSIVSESRDAAELYSTFAGEITGKAYPVESLSRGRYSVSVPLREDRIKILDRFSSSDKVGTRINRANISDECCLTAFVRGAFVACGTMTDPNKSYLLEFLIPYLHLSDDFLKVMQELNEKPQIDVMPGITQRRSGYVLYLRNSESIEDLLFLMGAHRSSFGLMEIKAEKHTRNIANRKKNFDIANITRSVSAGLDQADAIKRLKESGRFESLGDDLKELAELRLMYPEDSLRDLGEKLTVSLTRSGVYHRLEKIMAIAESEN